MPNPDEIAELRVNGQKFRDWEMVAVQKALQQEYTMMTFSAASPVESGSWAGQKLKIGDQCQCWLAGVKVAEGILMTRQVVFDARHHALQVQVASKPIDLNYASVEQSAGFRNYSLEAIANSMVKPYGMKFRVEGSPAGADKPFPRFHARPGEPVMSAIWRLCRMRNLFVTNDEDGNLVAKRIDGNGPVKAHLEEGRNIKSATCVMTDEYAYNKITALGTRPGNDQNWGDQARDTSASVVNPEVKRNKPSIRRAPEPGDSDDMRMHAEYLAAENIASMIQAEVIVQGWHDPAGDLWIKSVGENVTVKSALMFPSGSKVLAIQSVTHRQANGSGTETVLNLMLRPQGSNKVKADPDPLPSSVTKSATPEPADVTSV